MANRALALSSMLLLLACSGGGGGATDPPGPDGAGPEDAHVAHDSVDDDAQPSPDTASPSDATDPQPEPDALVAPSDVAGMEDTSTPEPSDVVPAGDAGPQGPPPTRVYATIVTHNEQDINQGCQPVLADEALFDENRAMTVAFAHAIADAGGAWDMQSDFRWIDQLEQWESEEDRAETGGMNILAWLATAFPGQIVVDAHNHESSHNYADVQMRLQNLGVPDTGVVGGILWSPVENEDWTRFREPLAGKQFPNFTWSPTILWGAATMNHSGPDSEASGVWRPAAADAFHTHAPEENLINVGLYRDAKYEVGGGEGLAALIQEVRDGLHPEGGMLTVSIFTDQCAMTAEEIQAFVDLIEGHQQDVDDGILVWATLPDVVATWKEVYGGQAYIVNAPDETTTPPEPTCPEQGCPQGMVCCEAPAPCAGTCVDHCAKDPMACPPGTVCLESGLCGPE